MLTANMSSSFAELTPVSNTASSSSTDAADDISQSVNRTNAQDFHRFIDELGFDEDNNDEIVIPDSPDRPEEDSDDEEEDLKIKYPYERKDYYQGLEERIHQRLETNDSAEADEQLWEVEQLLKEVKANKQMGTIFTPGSVFACVICAKAFPDAEGLQEHTNKAHDLNSKKFKCKVCGRGFTHKKNLESHQKLHRKEFECDECSLVFQFAATLHTHKRKAHQKEVDLNDDTIEVKKCEYCNKQFPAESFYRHFWYCKNKEKVKAQRAEKKKQQTMSVPPSPAMSTTSYASFTSLQPGPSYSPMVSPVASYRDKSCQVCGETFASRQSMLRHVGRKHPEAKNDPNVTAVRYVSTESPTHPYACQDCGKRLTSRAALTTHRARAHLNTERNQCHLCDKSYTVPSELQKHIRRVHEGEKPVSSKGAKLPELDDIF